MRIERSPSPSQVGFALGRRQFVIGATARPQHFSRHVVTTTPRRGRPPPAATPAADGTAAATTPVADATTAPAADVGDVTLGSNYSDEKPRRRSPRQSP